MSVRQALKQVEVEGACCASTKVTPNVESCETCENDQMCSFKMDRGTPKARGGVIQNLVFRRTLVFMMK